MCVFFFRRERQAVEAHRQAILPATAPRTANPEGKPHITTGSGVVTHSEARRGAGRSTPDDEIQDVRVLVNAAGEPPVEVSELAEWGAARKQDPPHILGAPAGMPVAAGHHDEAFNYTKVQGLRQGVATRHGEQDTPRLGLR